MGITDAEQVLQMIGDFDRLLVGVRDPALRRVGITREQWQVLRLLSDGQGHAMGDVSDATALTGATATRVVDSLVQSVQVYRRSDPLDRRRVLIYLAEPGQETLRQIDEAMMEYAEPLLADLEPAERADLIRLLKRVISAADTRPVQG